MKKSRRLFLPGDDYDMELVRDQMSVKDVHGTGGYRRNAIIDPAEIIGSDPHKISHAVTKEHEAVLKRSIDDCTRRTREI